jgi:uncharacterized damage-inducible protein DinB
MLNWYKRIVVICYPPKQQQQQQQQQQQMNSMKAYLIDTFRYNDWANRRLLDGIKHLTDQEESIKLFSHLISAQNKWMNRISKQLEDKSLSWFGESLPLALLEDEWDRSINEWIGYMEKLSDEELDFEVEFTRITDGQKMGVKLKDIALQLNYHSIHHRAQINKLMSQQGQAVPATDYIFTVLKEY